MPDTRWWCWHAGARRSAPFPAGGSGRSVPRVSDGNGPGAGTGAVLGAWLRVEWRARGRTLLVMALLFALATGTIVTAIAGARRGATAIDRLVDDSLSATVMVLPNQPGFDWSAVRALPEVESLTEFVVNSAVVVDPSDHDPDGVAFPPADDSVWQSIERPVVLDGRVPDPGRDDEVAITDQFRRRHGRGVGDQVTFQLPTPAQSDASLSGDDVGAPSGPKIVATIVGVIRSPWFSDTVDSADGAVILSPGVFSQHRANLIGANESVYVNALVRLGEGDSDIPAFKTGLADVSGRSDIEVFRLGEFVEHARDVTRFEAQALLAFALAAFIASALLIGQAVIRHVSAATEELEVFRMLGVGRRRAVVASAIAPTVAGVFGGVIGVVIATAASSRFPIGSASRYEPAPGTHLDGTVAFVAMVLVLAFVPTTAMLVASRRGGLPRAAPARREGWWTRADVGSVAASVGLRWAVDARSGRGSIPVRSAIVGTVVGIAGVVGALTIETGIDQATDDFEDFGQTYDFAVFQGIGGESFGPVEQTLGTVADDPDVAGVVDARSDVAQAGEVSVSVLSFVGIGPPIEQRLTDGRMPERTGEIAIGPRTASALNVGIGDRIELTGGRGSIMADVTGIVFLPAGPHNDYASGAWTTSDTYDELFDGFKFRFGLVDVEAGADVDAVIARLSSTIGEVEAGPIIPPVERAELLEIRPMPRMLALFLAVLGVGALGHALATTATRRRRDLAVLRAAGMTRRETRAIVLTQSCIIGTLGFCAGVPAGVVAGRQIWSVVADATPVAPGDPMAWTAVGLAPPTALAVALLLAAWPSRRVASLPVAEVLRGE